MNEQPIKRCSGGNVQAMPGSGEMTWQCDCGNHWSNCSEHAADKVALQQYDQQQIDRAGQHEVDRVVENEQNKQIANHQAIQQLRATLNHHDLPSFGIEQSSPIIIVNEGKKRAARKLGQLRCAIEQCRYTAITQGPVKQFLNEIIDIISEINDEL